MDGQGLDSIFESALWELRRKRSVHYNTIAATCRRIKPDFENKSVTARLRRAIREQRVERLGGAKYKIVAHGQAPPVLQYPATPPLSSPQKPSSDRQMLSMMEDVVAVQQELAAAMIQPDRIADINRLLGQLHRAFEGHMPVEQQSFVQLRTLATVNADVVRLRNQLQESAVANMHMRARLQTSQRRLADLLRRAVVSRGAILFVISELKSCLAELVDCTSKPHLELVEKTRAAVGAQLGAMLAESDAGQELMHRSVCRWQETLAGLQSEMNFYSQQYKCDQ